MKIEKTSQDEGYITVTEEEYQEQLARGLSEEEVIKPGRHKFIRGGFRKLHPDFDPSKTEFRYNITLALPPAVYQYYEQKANLAGAASYAEFLENILIDLMEKEAKIKTTAYPTQQESLLQDPQFIKAVAARVKKTLSKKSSTTAKSRRRAA